MLRNSMLLIGMVCCCSGCITSLTAAGQKVRVGKVPPQTGCEELGIVYGSGQGFPSSRMKMESAQNELRNQAAELSGNFVVMDAAAGDSNGVTLTGRAFKCSDVPPAGATRETNSVSQPRRTPEERLRELQGLLDKGLITQDEYDQKRKAILQSM